MGRFTKRQYRRAAKARIHFQLEWQRMMGATARRDGVFLIWE